MAQRLLAMEGCYNLRDIGGYQTLDSKNTRWRTVCPSHSLHCLTPASERLLLDYDLQRIIDLRTLLYLERQYGGIVSYLQTIGITHEQINHLHGMLVD